MLNKIRRLIIDLEPYYRLEIDDKSIRVRSFSKHAKGKELKQQITRDGYLRIKMKLLDGRFQYVRLHSLVAENTIGSRPIGLTVNHKDGNKLNNYPNNLEYVTRADNIKHAISLGLHVAVDPTRHGNYKDGRTLDHKRYQREWAKQAYWKKKNATKS